MTPTSVTVRVTFDVTMEKTIELDEIVQEMTDALEGCDDVTDVDKTATDVHNDY